MKDALLLELRDDVGYIGIQGRGTYLAAASVKKFYRALLQESVEKWVVDLEGCTELDSTMLGTLAGLGLKLKEVTTARLRILHCSARKAELLCDLGLDRLFEVERP